MYIRSLHLRNFKRFEKLDLVFPGDITVVKGPNEQGKSTVVEALIAVLFYDPRRSNKKFESLKQWNSDAWYVLRCVFEEGGETYELSKDFGAKTVSLVNTHTGELWNDSKEIEGILWKFGGYRNEKLFTSTAFVKQDSIQEIASGGKELNQALEDMVNAGAGGGSVADIIKRIDARLEETTRGLERPSKTPGRIKDLGDRHKEKEAALKEIKEKTTSFQEKSRVLKEKEELMKKLSFDLELKNEEWEDMKNYFIFEGHRKETGPRIEELSDDIELIEKLDRERQQLENELRKYPIRDRDLKDMYHFSKETEMRESRLRELRETVGGSRKERRVRAGRSVFLLAVIFFALFIVGLGGGIFIAPWFYAAWALMAFPFVLGAFTLLRLSGRRRRGVSSEIAAQEKKLVSLALSLKPILKRLDAQNVKEAEERLAYLKQVKNQAEQFSSKKEGVLRGKNLEGIKKDKRELEKLLALESAKIPQEIIADPPSHEDKKRIERATHDLEEKKKGLEEGYAALKGEVDALAINPDQLVKLEEELSNIETELGRLKRKVAAYHLLKDSLQEAKTRVVRGVRNALESFMKEFIVDVTLGRYSDLRIGEDLALEVYSPEKREMMDPHGSLSQGTIDQLYLVARFAFLKILTGAPETAQKNIIPGRPLVVLDDPFHTFDRERRARARELVKRLSHEFQIILFTHSDEYDSWGNIKTLEGEGSPEKIARGGVFS